MLTILCGKSASGKDTLLRQLVQNYNFTPIVSTTSRPPRKGEIEGVDYHFITRMEFERRIKEKNFLEYRSYKTLVQNKPDIWYYGSEKMELDPNKDYIVVLDLEGTQSFIDYYQDKTDIFPVYIDIPDELRKQRAMSRSSFDETEWERRCADDAIKFSPENVSKVTKVSLLNNRTIDDLIQTFLCCYENEKQANEIEME